MATPNSEWVYTYLPPLPGMTLDMCNALIGLCDGDLGVACEVLEAQYQRLADDPGHGASQVASNVSRTYQVASNVSHTSSE